MKTLYAISSLFLLMMSGIAVADNQRQLDGAEIIATFTGMSMVGNYADGVKFTETYHPNGSIDYHDDNMSADGHWYERHGLFCTFYTNVSGACFAVIKTGANCYEYYIREEEDGTVSPQAEKWNSVGWDKSKPSSCDLSDKVS